MPRAPSRKVGQDQFSTVVNTNHLGSKLGPFVLPRRHSIRLSINKTRTTVSLPTLTGLSTTRFMRAIAGVRGLARSSRVTGPFETSDRSRAEGNRGLCHGIRAARSQSGACPRQRGERVPPIFGDEIET